MAPDGQVPPHVPDREAARRRRVRNWALLVVLCGLAVLFYAITIAKLMTHA